MNLCGGCVVLWLVCMYGGLDTLLCNCRERRVGRGCGVRYVWVGLDGWVECLVRGGGYCTGTGMWVTESFARWIGVGMVVVVVIVVVGFTGLLLLLLVLFTAGVTLCG